MGIATCYAGVCLLRCMYRQLRWNANWNCTRPNLGRTRICVQLHSYAVACLTHCICIQPHFVDVLGYRIRPAMGSVACVNRCIALSCMCSQLNLYTHWIGTLPKSDSAEFGFSSLLYAIALVFILCVYATELACALELHPAAYPIACVLI